MLAIYPARYRDRLGEEETTIRNDGRTLRMVVRGVEFAGHHVGLLAPTDRADPHLAGFVLNRYGADSMELCACEIEYQVPVPVASCERIEEGMLHIRMELGQPLGDRGLDREDLRLTLRFDDHDYHGTGTSGWFEDELVEIQSALPEGVYMKACINCGLSDYSPYGHDLFGDMLCFRGSKDEYRSVQTKRDLLKVLDCVTERVQETYLCPEFERRKPGTGYRG